MPNVDWLKDAESHAKRHFLDTWTASGHARRANLTGDCTNGSSFESRKLAVLDHRGVSSGRMI